MLATVQSWFSGELEEGSWDTFRDRLTALFDDPTAENAEAIVIAADHLFRQADQGTNSGVKVADIEAAARALETLALDPSVPDLLAVRAGSLLGSRQVWKRGLRHGS